jgi:hypothetical protein
MKLKTLFFAVIAIFTAATFTFAQDSVAPPVEFRKVENKAFTQGEKLTFDVNYGFVTAGIATMEIGNTLLNVNGREAYDITVSVNSTSGFDAVYRVRDYYKSYLDKEGLFPWKFEQHIREGNYARDFEAIFDHQNLKAKAYTGEKDPKKFEGEYDIPMYTQDAVSAFYFFRTLDYSNLKEGDMVKLQNFYKDKTYPLDVKFLGRETIEVPAGEFRCIIVQPLVVEGGLFKSEGEIVVWMTDDERRMPVRVRTKVIVGSMDVELTEYSGLAGPLRAKL